eukprot:3628818-Alexandrium_andersonii.AAC.1
MHWLGSAVRRRPGCNGKAPDAPDCIRDKTPAEKSLDPPPAVQVLIDAIPTPNLQPDPMLVDPTEKEEQASKRLKELEQITQRLDREAGPSCTSRLQGGDEAPQSKGYCWEGATAGGLPTGVA